MTSDKTCRVLIVNDDPAQLNMAGQLVRKAGYEVVLCNSAEEALEILQREDPPDLIITDVYMPGIDGWRLCRLLRSPAFPRINRTPILVLSATFAGADTEQITRQIGANAFLPAPYDPPELIRLVGELLQGQAEARRSSVLVVEDAEAQRSEVVRGLRANGYEVFEAQDGRSARKEFAEHHPQVVLLAYRLPDTTAVELLPLFKFRGSDRVVIVTTDDPSPDLAVQLLRSGADAHIRKPFDIEYLVDQVTKALRERALVRVEELLEDRNRRLRASEARYRAIVEDQSELIFRFLPDGKLTFVNDAFCRYFGKQREELIGRSYLPLIAEEDREKSERHPSTLSRKSPVGTLQHRVVDANGVLQWLQRTDRAVFDERGRLNEFQAVAHDITERKQMVEELLDSGELLRATLESTADGILAVNDQGRVTHTNGRFAEMWRIPRALMGTNDSETLLDYLVDQLEEPQAFLSKFQDLYDASSEEPEALVFKDGRVFEHFFCPLIQGGRIAGRVWSFRDVTDRKRAEEALRSRVEFERLVTSIATSFITPRADEIDQGINRALQAVGELIQVDRSYVFLFNDNATKMSNTHEWCAPGIEPRIHEGEALPVDAYPWSQERIRRLETVHIPSVADLPPEATEKEALESRQVRSLMLFPIFHGDRLYGFLGFDAVRSTRVWSEETIALLRIVSEIFAKAFERKRAEGDDR